jgi:hypothetical protein
MSFSMQSGKTTAIAVVRDIVWTSWKERLLAERLLRKAKIVESYLQQNKFHWEETFWWLLARNFGTKVNADAFEAVARSIPLSVLARQKQQIHRVEALLLGQAGLLDQEFRDHYPVLLQKEYKFQARKLGLKRVSVPCYFLRMRPANFPTVRLAQLAMLVRESAHLLSRIREAASAKDLRQWFEVTANDYWHYHYRFEERSSFRKKTLGSEMIDNIIINTIAPAMFAYGSYHGEQRYKDKALQWLGQTEAERNAVIRGFRQIGIDSQTAYDSQALIELKSEYCDKRRCLDCGVGNAVLKGI